MARAGARAGGTEGDAVSLTLADHARTTGQFDAAARAVLPAVAGSTVVETGLALGAGRDTLRRPKPLGAEIVPAATGVTGIAGVKP